MRLKRVGYAKDFCDMRALLVLSLILGLAGCSGKKVSSVRGSSAAAPVSAGGSAMVRFEYGPGQLLALCDSAIKKTTIQLDEIAHLKPKARKLKSTLLKFESTLADLSDSTTPLTFMNYVSTDPTTHAEGAGCEEKLGQYLVEVFSRRDVYRALKGQKPKTAAAKRLKKETLRNFEDNGLKLSDAKLVQVKALKQELAAKETQFSTNNNNDQTVVIFSNDELSGLPEDFKSRLPRDPDGKYIVTTKSTDYVPVMENAIFGPTRKKMQTAYWNRAAGLNTHLLEDAIGLRRKIAHLMGYKTWADYKVHDRMAKSGAKILSFLNGLKAKLSKRNHKDIEELGAFKVTLTNDLTAQPAVKSWDLSYLSYQLRKKQYQLDDELIKQYFPSDLVINGMFQVYSKLLGVNFSEIKNARVWASGVKLYQIQDAKSEKVIGYFYTDFFPRVAKYGHAAAFPIFSGRELDRGDYAKPVSAIVANLAPPANGKPSLLNHEEVETVFHEFGHIMHQTLTKVPYASLSGSSVAQDFVEAPSQMLENWVWNAEILKSLSGFYLDPSKKLPDALLKQMIRARDFQQGYNYMRQLMLGLLDMGYHTTEEPVNVTTAYNQLYQEMIGVEMPVDTHFPASFGHLMGGYDAGYYGYLWSEVYAADMFTRFQKAKLGLLDPKVGAEYRKYVLEAGDLEDASVLLRKFLKRAPNSRAFFKKLHL